MSREIKFRAWSNGAKRMMYFGNSGVTLADTMLSHGEEWGMFFSLDEKSHVYIGTYEVMQYTGLKDKNGAGTCIYEGDIISLNGIIIGNKYENAEILKETTNLLVEGVGTKTWRDTEQAAVSRGCHYAE